MTPPIIYIDSFNPHLRVAVYPGEGAPSITGGYGGWEAIERPRRTPLTAWKGFPAQQLALPILFDAFWNSGTLDDEPDGEKIEERIEKLESMAGRGEGGGKTQPPLIKLTGPGNLIPREELTWVIDTIEWDSAGAILDEDGNRLRQACTVNFLEYVEDKALTARSVANRAAIKARRKHKRTYVVRKGDTLQSIARSQLGDPDKWRAIWLLNRTKIPDTRHLKVNLRLRLPE